MDFVTWRRPPPDAQVLDHHHWGQMLVAVSSSWARTVDKAVAVHRISGTIWVTAMQLRELLGLIPDDRSRVEVIITLVLRLADPQNMKVMRACIPDHSDTGVWRRVVRRVGTLALFPYYQPEEFYFDNDLTTYEDRMATAIAVQLAAHERLENVRNPDLINPDGSQGSLEYGISSSWQSYDSVPQGGKIKFQYVCGPEDRRFGLRKELAMKYGGWRAKVDGPRHVMWWKSLADVPEPLLTFLYNCMEHFRDARQVFGVCNVSFSGRVSRQELETMIAHSNWSDFQRDPNLAKQVFRALDPDNSGDVSLAEWAALQYLWNELELSILEFLKFVDRNFGGSFDMAWDEIEGGADALDLRAWQEGVQEIGYWGHCIPIFYFAAVEIGRDTVMTRASWDKLHDMWYQREELLEKITRFEQDLFRSESLLRSRTPSSRPESARPPSGDLGARPDSD